MTRTCTAAWRSWQSKELAGDGREGGLGGSPRDGSPPQPSAQGWGSCSPRQRITVLHPRSRGGMAVASSPRPGARRAGLSAAVGVGLGPRLPGRARPLRGRKALFQKLGPREHRPRAGAAGDSGLSLGLTGAGAGLRLQAGASWSHRDVPCFPKPWSGLPLSPPFPLQGLPGPSHAAWPGHPSGRFT